MAKRTETQAPVRPEPTDEDVVRRAYELYEARGGQHGAAYAYEDWLQAERELRSEHEREATIEPAS